MLGRLEQAVRPYLYVISHHITSHPHMTVSSKRSINQSINVSSLHLYHVPYVDSQCSCHWIHWHPLPITVVLLRTTIHLQAGLGYILSIVLYIRGDGINQRILMRRTSSSHHLYWQRYNGTASSVIISTSPCISSHPIPSSLYVTCSKTVNAPESV